MTRAVIYLTAAVLFCAVNLTCATQYHQNYHHGSQQPAVAEDHRVDEKDYDVGGWSPYWLLCAPILFIPLVLLLCTPLFHRPYDAHHHHHGHHGHHSPGHGYGWGTYNLGWKRSADDKEEVTGRVLDSISKRKG